MSEFHDAHGLMILALRNARRARQRAEVGDIDGAVEGLLQAKRWQTLADRKRPPKLKTAEYCARVQWVVAGIAKARAALVSVARSSLS